MAICTLFLTILTSACHVSGYSSGAFLEVSLVSDIVQLGSSAEIRIKRFLPAVKDTRFQEISCGYLLKSESLVPFAKLLKASNAFVRKEGPPAYKGRVRVRGNATITIKNIRFRDQGSIFYCRLLYCNESQQNVVEILKYMEVKRVFAKPRAVNITTSSFPKLPNCSLTVIKCIFTGNPRVDVTWNVDDRIDGMKTSSYNGNNGLIMTDAIYTITEVPQSDSNYNITCFGQSAYGKAMLTTTFSTKKQRKPKPNLSKSSTSNATLIPIVIVTIVNMSTCYRRKVT